MPVRVMSEIGGVGSGWGVKDGNLWLGRMLLKCRKGVWGKIIPSIIDRLYIKRIRATRREIQIDFEILRVKLTFTLCHSVKMLKVKLKGSAKANVIQYFRIRRPPDDGGWTLLDTHGYTRFQQLWLTGSIHRLLATLFA